MAVTIPIPEYVMQVLQALNAAGHAAYVVGGCVRDSLMGRVPQDWDICTDATPQNMQTALGSFRLLETGLQHGTLTVIVAGQPLEVTSFRVDGSYSDHRHPDAVQFTQNLRADLSRRDFTVNAMAFHPEHGLVDLFGGQADIEKRQIRCVGDAHLRFQEDALRILRALRFASVLNFTVEKQTAQSIFAQQGLLQHVARERICKELLALLCGENVAAVLLQFAAIMFTVIPQLAPTQGFPQRTPYHMCDVWQHSVYSVAAAPAVPELRLTMLLHDCGKPECLHPDADGVAHFYGHAQRSAELALEVMQSLRCSNAMQKRVCTLIRHHDIRFPAAPPRRAVTKLLAKLGPELFFALLDVMRADSAAKAPQYQSTAELDAVQQLAEELLRQGACLQLKDLAVNGEDLLQSGMPQGKAIGAALQQLLLAAQNEQVANEREALLAYVKKQNANLFIE